MSAEIPQELVERAIAFVRRMAVKAIDERYLGFEAATAREIVAELPEPVDPDLIEARDVAGDIMAAWSSGAQTFASGAINAVRTGNDDRHFLVVGALAGIKRGRDLARAAIEGGRS